VIDALRRINAQPKVFDTDVQNLLDVEWSAFDSTESSELIDALQQCVQKLSPYARRLIELRFHAGLSGTELAHAVQRTVNIVHVALTRTYKTLSECIRKRTEKVSDGR
jgi:RNA polymerase sigma factor (sigma-70 family)